jgi:hypothetical protein
MTRLALSGVGAASYGAFAPKTPAGGASRNPGTLTRLGQGGLMAAGYSPFVAKAPATVENTPTIPPVVIGGGGGNRYQAYYDARSRHYEIPVPDHREDEEEEIIITILLEVAHGLLH